MVDRFLIDADVLIDFFRGRPEAEAFISGLRSRPIVCTITVAESFAGVRDGSERDELETFLRRCAVIDIDEPISVRAGLLLRQYRKSHGTGLADALVASAAESSNARVAMLNQKHYPMLGDVLVPYRKP